MKLDSLKDLYIHELQDLYNAEARLIDALPQMADRATSGQLRNAFTEHLEETKQHRQRLEQILGDLKIKPGGEKCEAMEGLIKEGEEILKAKGDGDTIDAGLIATGNRVEHYEMAGYGAARTHAQTLGFEEHARLLQETLDEEGNADKKLTSIAEQCNKAAATA
jgi:ferritin-like metal-binding protein YciE